jgi:hypothetical protein
VGERSQCGNDGGRFHLRMIFRVLSYCQGSTPQMAPGHAPTTAAGGSLVLDDLQKIWRDNLGDARDEGRFAAVARHQGLSDSALLKRLVDLMLQSAGAAGVGTPGGADRNSRDSRLTVRIRPDDQLLLRERAAARGMAATLPISFAPVRSRWQ